MAWAVGGAALAGLLVAGCPGDPLACGEAQDPDASAPGLVDNPLVGAHVGTLTWLETMKPTLVLVSVVAAGPVSHAVEVPGSGSCTAGHALTLDVSVETSDGVIPPTSETDQDIWVEPDGQLDLDTLNVSVDAARVLAGAVAPEEPDLASLHPTIALTLARGSHGASLTGTLVATSPETSVTLATLAF